MTSAEADEKNRAHTTAVNETDKQTVCLQYDIFANPSPRLWRGENRKFYGDGSWSLVGKPPRTLKGTIVEAEYDHLSHATWECRCRVVPAPKPGKRPLSGEIKRSRGNADDKLDLLVNTPTPQFR